MFLLDKNNLFTWYNLFLVLGLDKSFPFLVDIGFPLHDTYWQIQQLSQDFVKKMFEHEMELFYIGEPSAVSKKLFQDFYTVLEERIGEENAQTFCNWGHKLMHDTKLDTKFEHKLSPFWWDLRKASRADTITHPNDPQMRPLRMLIERYNYHQRVMCDAFDDIEDFPKNDWEELAYTLYTRIGDDRNNPDFHGTSPLDFLECTVSNLLWLNFLVQLQTIPAIEELLMKLNLHQDYVFLSNIFLPLNTLPK